jgi:metal-dependent amidase/aminoacylase/carboxypeptidase family protein
MIHIIHRMQLMTHRGLLFSVAVAALAGRPATAQRAPSAELRRQVDSVLAGHESQWIELRRDLHRHPEVSGAEERTAGIVAARLEALKLEVRRGIGGHGVVGILRGGRPGPLVAFRADMDAVPSTAADPVEFASMTAGVRHICGHDLHTTIGLAIAEGLAAIRTELAGSVMFIFQPAEERATGAKAMLADGLFKASKPVAIFAVHTAPFPVGQLGTLPGPMMAGRDAVRVTISGPGNLKALADSASRIILGVGTISGPAALAPAPDGFVFAQVAPARSVAAGRWLVEGSLTMASPAARARVRQVIEQSLAKLAAPGVSIAPVYEVKMIAGVTNDSALVSQANASIRAALGVGAVIPVPGIYPAFSEDFGSFEDQIPGAFYFLGVANQAKGWSGMPHSPDYVADEAAIQIGARAMTAAILDRLAGSRPPAS